MVEKISFVLIICLTLGSCADKKLSISRSIFPKGRLKLNGYYTSQIDSINISNLFLYENGVILNDYSYKPLVEVIKDSVTMYKELNLDLKYEDKTCWGVFRIDDHKITIEQWEPSVGGGLPTLLWEGEIINDSTFVIKKASLSVKRKTKSSEAYFRFVPFAFKPDSTNQFIPD